MRRLFWTGIAATYMTTAISLTPIKDIASQQSYNCRHCTLKLLQHGHGYTRSQLSTVEGSLRPFSPSHPSYDQFNGSFALPQSQRQSRDPRTGWDKDTAFSRDTRLSTDNEPQSPRSSVSDTASDTPPETDNSRSEEGPDEELRAKKPSPTDMYEGPNYFTAQITQVFVSDDPSPVRLPDHDSLNDFRALPSPAGQLPDVPNKLFASLGELQSYASGLIKDIENRDIQSAELEHKVQRLTSSLRDLGAQLDASLQESANMSFRLEGLSRELRKRDKEVLERDIAFDDLRTQYRRANTNAQNLLSDLRRADSEHLAKLRRCDADYSVLRSVAERLVDHYRELESARAFEQKELAAAKATIESLEVQFSHLRTSVPSAVDQMCAEEERARQRHPSIPVYFQGHEDPQARYMGNYPTRRTPRASSPASTIGP